jgi:hypothetical protein
MPDRYPVEVLGEYVDDGTMTMSLAELTEQVVGHRIAATEQRGSEFVITLDNGKQVVMVERADCCAYTEVESFLLHPERVDHVITGVGTTDGFSTWHVYADMGDVLEMQVGWSCGNPFYYGYGFHIAVRENTDA